MTKILFSFIPAKKYLNLFCGAIGQWTVPSVVGVPCFSPSISRVLKAWRGESLSPFRPFALSPFRAFALSRYSGDQKN
ncbi:MAG: hypothetical protein LBF89_09820 [Bacteroidales bacterium]|nr:hypothetical protein [Bacteroidales bacterium]